MDFTVIKGDTIVVSGTASWDGNADMTGWEAEVVLRSEPATTELGPALEYLNFEWLDVTQGTWAAQSTTELTWTLPLGVYLLYVTFIDDQGRRVTPPSYTIMVSA